MLWLRWYPGSLQLNASAAVVLTIVKWSCPQVLWWEVVNGVSQSQRPEMIEKANIFLSSPKYFSATRVNLQQSPGVFDDGAHVQRRLVLSTMLRAVRRCPVTRIRTARGLVLPAWGRFQSNRYSQRHAQDNGHFQGKLPQITVVKWTIVLISSTHGCREMNQSYARLLQ